MFYVGKSLLHEALFGLSSESTSAHISTHSTTYSDGGRALRAAAGSRAAVTAIGGGRRTKATRHGGRHEPTALDRGRPRPNAKTHVAALTAAHRCATLDAAAAPLPVVWSRVKRSPRGCAERSHRRRNSPEIEELDHPLVTPTTAESRPHR